MVLMTITWTMSYMHCNFHGNHRNKTYLNVHFCGLTKWEQSPHFVGVYTNGGPHLHGFTRTIANGPVTP